MSTRRKWKDSLDGGERLHRHNRRWYNRSMESHLGLSMLGWTTWRSNSRRSQNQYFSAMMATSHHPSTPASRSPSYTHPNCNNHLWSCSRCWQALKPRKTPPWPRRRTASEIAVTVIIKVLLSFHSCTAILARTHKKNTTIYANQLRDNLIFRNLRDLKGVNLFQLFIN